MQQNLAVWPTASSSSIPSSHPLYAPLSYGKLFTSGPRLAGAVGAVVGGGDVGGVARMFAGYIRTSGDLHDVR